MQIRNFRNDPNYPKKHILLLEQFVGEDDMCDHLLFNWDNDTTLSLFESPKKFVSFTRNKS